MRPARVCLFTDSRDPSGMGVHMLTLAAGLQARYDLAVACPIDGGGRELLARCREQGLATLAAPRQTDVGSLRDWLSAHAFDVFHAHAGIGWEGHAAIRAARLAQVPAVIRTEHLPYVLDDARQMREHAQLVPMVDRLIVVSDGVAASFLAAGVPAKKLRVVRNGIGPGRARRSAWLRAAVRQRSGLPADAHLALTVARLSGQKAHATLLAAIPSVLSSRPNVHFLWVGAGPLGPDLHAQIEQAGLKHRVHLLGVRGDVADLLAASDLFILPSLFEGLPLALLEAMGAGLPVIATHVCGSAEVVQDGLSGRLVPPRDPPALAAAILEVLDNPDLASRWGAAARARVKRDFSARAMADRVAAIYDEVLHVSHATMQAGAA